MFDFIVHHLEQINQIAQLLIALLTLHEWIRKLRKEKLGYTQEQFAERLGVQPRTVQRWEQGIRTPRQEHLLMMQDFQEINDSRGPSILQIRSRQKLQEMFASSDVDTLKALCSLVEE